jgi:hypothetical protein
MEKCINCDGVYELNESDATQKLAFCCERCEDEYLEFLGQPLEFL